MIRILVCLVLALMLARGGMSQSGTNDHIFPASAKAKSYIDFDRRGFLIRGKREFLVSAGMEYARVPRGLWNDRLLRLKRAGFNCIEIYCFWNFHEPREGQFDFSGDRDLDAFLKLAKKMDLYVIARVGPYYCAEWDNGGYPLWLRFKPGLRVREHNAAFEKYTDLFWDTLMPIVCRNQINRGGSVILVQLENEHPAGWGTDMPNAYFLHLRSKALSLGLDVPYFFSGLHHAADPAGDGKLDDPGRPNPWMSTEFWCVSFNRYGSTDQDAREFERKTWRIIANGGNGYNYYMAHGGSNFEYSNNDEDAASYDYGAAVGQAGDLRPLYAVFKRAAFFSRSFASILENSTNITELYNRISTNANIRVTARRSPAGDLIFLDNPTDSARAVPLNAAALPNADTIQLSPGEIFPLAHQVRLNQSTTLQWGLARILGISRQGNNKTIVIYGEPGSTADLYFNTHGKPSIIRGNEAFSTAAGLLRLHTRFSGEGKPRLYSFVVDQQSVSVLAVNEKLSERTWFIGDEGKTYIVCGPYYVTQLQQADGGIRISTERPWAERAAGPAWVLNGSRLEELKPASPTAGDQNSVLKTSRWQMKTAWRAAAPGFDDGYWKKSDDPLQMGADGDLTADAWYRTRIQVDSAGTYTLLVKGGDRGTLYVDGEKISSLSLKSGEITLALSAGAHQLAIFTAHDGRDKLAAYLGPIDHVASKGLFGEALLIRGRNSIQNLETWRFLKAGSADAAAGEMPGADHPGWEKYTIGQDAFGLHEGFGWFRISLTDPPEGVTRMQLDFKSVDENATVFLNGMRVARQVGWNIPFQINVNRVDTLKKPIVLTVFIENYSQEGGINKAVHASYLPPATRRLTGWAMRGGVADPRLSGDWAVMDERAAGGGPCFFQASFSYRPVAGSQPAYRVITKGLGHGSVWVNGHNLGRYPEKIPVSGLYIPPCWMKNGVNTIRLYDEDGRQPGQISIEAETAASTYTDWLKTVR